MVLTVSLSKPGSKREIARKPSLGDEEADFSNGRDLCPDGAISADTGEVGEGPPHHPWQRFISSCFTVFYTFPQSYPHHP